MPGKTWKGWALLGLAFCFGGFAARTEATPLAVKVTVAVHNQAEVSPATLADAERTARAIFRQAGLDIEIVNCRVPAKETQTDSFCRTTEYPKHLHLTIAFRSKNLNRRTLGVAYLGEDGRGCYSDVFFEPAEDLHEHSDVELGTLLGHVLAHEIAHLLLGANSHSETGIMRAHWDNKDLDEARKNALLFTDAQSLAMREKVTERWCRAHEDSAAEPVR